MKYCTHCEKDVSSVVRCVEETYPVLGEDTTIQATVRFCEECGNSIWDDVLDNQNLLDAFDAYRQKHNISKAKKLQRSKDNVRIKETYPSL